MSSSVLLAGDQDAVDAPLVPSEAITTNALSRHLSDLHTLTWLALLAVNITGRTIVFHPIQLAIVRKRITRAEKPPRVWGMISAAYRGGTSTFGVNTYNFGRGGVCGCYRGLGAALTSNLIGEMSYLFTLEVVKERLISRGGDPQADPHHSPDRSSPERSSHSFSTAAGCGDGASGTYRSLGKEDERAGDDSYDFSANSTATAIAAIFGDVVALVLVTPVALICSRQMTAAYGMAATSEYRSMSKTFKELWHTFQTPAGHLQRPTSWRWWQDGVRGIYQGTTAGILRIPSSGCWWALYTKTKELLYNTASPTLQRLEEKRQRAAPEGQSPSPLWRQNWLLSPTDNPILNAAAGTVASVITTVLFNPLAVIQTRQQTLPPEFWAKRLAQYEAQRTSRWYPVEHPFRRVVVVTRDLLHREGVRGLFKGASANVGVSVLDGVVFSLFFELTKLGSDTQFLNQLSNTQSRKEGP